jgi:hypothetical protein
MNRRFSTKPRNAASEAVGGCRHHTSDAVAQLVETSEDQVKVSAAKTLGETREAEREVRRCCSQDMSVAAG